MALIRFSPRFNPIDALLSLQQELDRTFESPTQGFDLGVSGRGVFPPTNVFADKDGYIVRMEVPGVAPEAINIESHGRTLTISGKRELQLLKEQASIVTNVGVASFHAPSS